MELTDIGDVIVLNNIVRSDIETIESINKGINSVSGTVINSEQMAIIEKLLIEKQRLIKEVKDLRSLANRKMFNSSKSYTYDTEFNLVNVTKVKR